MSRLTAGPKQVKLQRKCGQKNAPTRFGVGVSDGNGGNLETHNLNAVPASNRAPLSIQSKFIAADICLVPEIFSFLRLGSAVARLCAGGFRWMKTSRGLLASLHLIGAHVPLRLRKGPSHWHVYYSAADIARFWDLWVSASFKHKVRGIRRAVLLRAWVCPCVMWRVEGSHASGSVSSTNTRPERRINIRG